MIHHLSIVGVFLGAFLLLTPFELFLPIIRMPGPPMPATPTATATLPDAETGTPTHTATWTASPTGTATSTPSNTVQGTPTLAPTAPPLPTTPTPTPDIGVLDNHTSYTQTFSSRYIAGEVRNNDDSALRSVVVKAEVFDANNQLIRTETSFARRNIIPPGETSCFIILFYEPPTTWHSYQISAQGSRTGEAPRPFAITELHIGPNPHSFELFGLVRNDSGEPLDVARIVTTLYDDNGGVIDCDVAFAKTAPLAPGESSAWNLIFYGLNPESVAGKQVIAD